MVSEEPDISVLRVEVHSDEKKNADVNFEKIPAQSTVNIMHLILRNVTLHM
jgi:hypothetical protein